MEGASPRDIPNIQFKISESIERRQTQIRYISGWNSKWHPFYNFFAKQMHDFSKATGIEGLEMRDFMTFRHAYGVPPHEWDEEFHQGVRTFLRSLKKARPSLLCIGYNSAGPANRRSFVPGIWS